MLRNLKGQLVDLSALDVLAAATEIYGDFQRIVQLRHGLDRELHVHNRSGNPSDSADAAFLCDDFLDDGRHMPSLSFLRWRRPARRLRRRFR